MDLVLRAVVAPFVLCVVILQATAIGQDAGDGNKELQVLTKLLGTWDVEYTSRRSQATSEIKFELILNGRYIQRTGSTAPTAANYKLLQLMTYDPGEKCYRMWAHSSEPSLPAIEQRGKWDEVTQTLTWERKETSGETTTTTIKFDSESVMQWTISYRDANGDAVENRTTRLVAKLRKKQN